MKLKSSKTNVMKRLCYEKDLVSLVEACQDYIDQSGQEERQAYQEELDRVKDNFCQLVESGVFHDACGKTVNVFENWGQACAEVVTEY